LRKQYDKNISKPLRLGWSGISLKAYPLNMFKPLVNSGSVCLYIISEKKPLLDVPYEFKKWSYKTFPENIIKCDLCVSPREIDNNYDLGHSLFKIAAFMSEGVPALASPIPSYYLILKDGMGGQICKTFNDWNEQIEKCLEDQYILRTWTKETYKVIEPFSTLNISNQIINRINFLLDL
jgi:glycosyltransferase involved in cell wall biosynthesis